MEREKVSRAAVLIGRGQWGVSRVPKTGSPSTCTSSQSDFLLAFRGNTYFPPSSPDTSFSPPFPGTGSRYLSHSRGSHCISPYRREVRKPWVSSSFPLYSSSNTLVPPFHLLNKCMQATVALIVPYLMWVAGNDSNCRERKSSRCFS